MKTKWIIENFTDSEDYNDLAVAVKESGRNLQTMDKHNKFSIDFSRYLPGDLVIFQGSIQGTKHAVEKLPDCWPVVFSSFEKFACSAYYPKLYKFLFNDKHEFTTIQRLKDDRFYFYKTYGKEALIFIRPDSGEKIFTGQLLDLQDFDRFFKNNIICNASDNDIAIVSTPKKINGEWRFVVSEFGDIIAHSTYQYQGQKCLIPAVPCGALSKVEEILEVGYHPDVVYCIDICEDADGNFWLLELTSFSSAGLYATDKRKVVNEVSEIIESYTINKE